MRGGGPEGLEETRHRKDIGIQVGKSGHRDGAFHGKSEESKGREMHGHDR